MKFLLAFVFTCCLIGSADSQTLQKLSLGIQGGLTTPMSVSVSGEQPVEFKPHRSADLSKGIFLQYDLSKQFYVRSTLKKANIVLVNRAKSTPTDTQKYEGDFGASFYNRQLELSLGYRKNLSELWSLTASLGATYLDMESTGNPEMSLGIPTPGEPFWVSRAPIVVKEKAILANTAIGLEYKTRRDNVFSLEFGYYKGFQTVANYKFMITDRFSQEPEVPVFQSSLNSRGDYTEIRLGYRMPIQKFTNLYKAVNNPKPKPTPEPDSIRNQRYIGKYWGLEAARQTFYSTQVVELPNFTDKSRVVSPWTPSFTFFKGYQFKSRFSLEAGLRAGASSVASNTDAVPIAGFNGGWSGGTWSVLTLTIPLSVKYALPVYRNKLFLSPEVGFWQSYAFGMGATDAYPTMNGTPTHLKGYGHDYFVGYHAGLSLNGRVGKRTEIGIGYRYVNRFTDKPLMSKAPDHGPNSPLPHVLISRSNLRHDMVTISFRKFLRK